jgi:hypothetical protein
MRTCSGLPCSLWLELLALVAEVTVVACSYGVVDVMRRWLNWPRSTSTR